MDLSRRALKVGLTMLMLGGLAERVMAHAGHAPPTEDAFSNGFLHPVLGIDHLLAAVAVGLLAVRLGGRASWLLPVTFLASLLIGGVLASAGVNLPLVEAGIALSVLVLGAMVAAPACVPTVFAGSLAGAFALFHGYAHVAELSGAAVLPYALGLALTTFALHASGIAAASWALRAQRPYLVRFAGATIVAVFAMQLLFG